MPHPRLPVLVIDDDEALRARFGLLLGRAGIDNQIATGDGEAAAALVSRGEVSLVLLDLYLPEARGEGLLERFSRESPRIPVIVVTGESEPETIVRCIRAGAIDYLVKPVPEERFLVSLRNGLLQAELREQAEGFRERALEGGLRQPGAFAAIVTEDPRMILLEQYAESIAASGQPVLVTGETGTGKELFARAIHAASGRSGPFVAVNLAGVDEEVFSDTLFGHRRGAFTGAETARAGLLAEAAGGSIFLDEIGDLGPRAQVKLLRLFQEGEYYPLGADEPRSSDARVLAATAKDLGAAVRAGQFRGDLYYRLQTHPVSLPPLRERRGDLGPLVRHLARKSALALGKPAPEASEAFIAALAEHDFPGNVRELESLVHDALARSPRGILEPGLIRERLGGGLPAGFAEEGGQAASPPPDRLAARIGELFEKGAFPRLAAVEELLLELALERCGGNMSRAAELLGTSRQTLYAHRKRPPGAGRD